jgi:3-methyl-2-oxobutanoate hydroxymethyltransferase
MSLQRELKKITVTHLLELKKQGEKITVLTAYDALLAELIDNAGCEVILVGDSGGMVMGGRENTISVTMDDMLFYTKSVKNGVKSALLIADMPFLSYQVSIEKAIENAGRFLQEAGAEGVKIEGGEAMIDTVSALVKRGIPVMGHLGLTPQSINVLGGYKVQGVDKNKAHIMIEDAKMLEDAGAFSIVLEKIPAELAKEITASVKIPTIGIGAGLHCDGQVLVSYDMLGMFTKFKPRFARRYAELGTLIEKACREYIKDVKNSHFPSQDESY